MVLFGPCFYQSMFDFLQRLKEPVGTAIQNNSCEQVHLQTNSSDACSDRHWRNAVLESMCQSLGDDEGGVQACIREAIVHFQDIDHTTRVKVCIYWLIAEVFCR